MTQYINKDALVAEIEKRREESWLGHYTKEKGIVFDITDDILSFINTLEVIDPYEQCIQYASIEGGIKAHAEDYSFNIESELFNQLTPEQQLLWRKEIEQAVISGGEIGVELAMDDRYKENKEPVSEKKCMFTKDIYTDEDRKVLCEDCEEKCEYSKKEEPVSQDWEEELDNW